MLQIRLSAIFIGMDNELLIKRYNAYYQGWCLALGEHVANRDGDRDVYWLEGEDRIGLAVAPNLRRQLNQALLGHHDKIPKLVLEDDRIIAEDIIVYQLTDGVDREGMSKLKAFLDSKDQLYLFLTSHFFYPPGTRIITFAREKPTIILYKEMQPLKVLIK